MSSEKIVILGTGYVGFPLAVILARSGFKVVGVDIREELCPQFRKQENEKEPRAHQIATYYRPAQLQHSRGHGSFLVTRSVPLERITQSAST